MHRIISRTNLEDVIGSRPRAIYSWSTHDSRQAIAFHKKMVPFEKGKAWRCAGMSKSLIPNSYYEKPNDQMIALAAVCL